MVRPVVAPYSPAVQLLQMAAPARENFPAAQLPPHAEEFEPVDDAYRPALQFVHAIDPLVEYRPAGHGPVHDDDVFAVVAP